MGKVFPKASQASRGMVKARADGAEKSIAPELPVESGKRVEPAGCARERAGA